MLTIDDTKFEAVRQQYFQVYFWDLINLLKGTVNEVKFFGYLDTCEKSINRQELASLLYEYDEDALPDIMATALAAECRRGHFKMIEALTELATDSAYRMAQYHFDNHLDMEHEEST